MKDLWSLIKQPMVSCLLTAFAVATSNSVFAQNEATVSLVRIAENGNVTCNGQPSHTFFYMAQPNRRDAVLALEERTIILTRQALRKDAERSGIRRYRRQFTHRGARYVIRMAFHRGKLKRIYLIENVTTGAGSCRFRYRN